MADLTLFSAGSFRSALTDIVTEFERQFACRIKTLFSPAGLLRQRIAQGEHCDLFISANTENVTQLAKLGKVFQQQIIAFNHLALTTLDLPQFRGKSAVDILLDFNFRLATSTPHADPCGDYAWQLFDLLTNRYPQAVELKQRALQLVGGNPKGVQIPEGQIAAVYLLQHNYADMMLGYAHYAEKVRSAGLLSHRFPPEWQIKVHYVAAQLNHHPLCSHFFKFLGEPWAQEKIQRQGFLTKSQG